MPSAPPAKTSIKLTPNFACSDSATFLPKAPAILTPAKQPSPSDAPLSLMHVPPHERTPESLGLRGQHEEMRKVYLDIADRVKKVGKAKLGVPLGHSAMPFSATELKAMGVVYASLHPAIAARIMSS